MSEKALLHWEERFFLFFPLPELPLLPAVLLGWNKRLLSCLTESLQLKVVPEAAAFSSSSSVCLSDILCTVLRVEYDRQSCSLLGRPKHYLTYIDNATPGSILSFKKLSERVPKLNWCKTESMSESVLKFAPKWRILDISAHCIVDFSKALTQTPENLSPHHNEERTAYNDKSTSYNDVKQSTAYNVKMTSYNDKTTTYNDESTAYKDKSTAYNYKSTAYNDESTAYNDESTAYKDESTAYNDESTAYNKKSSAYNMKGTAYNAKCTAYKVKCTAYNEKCTAYN